MRTWKFATMLLVFAIAMACNTTEETDQKTEEQPLAQPMHLEDADSAMNDGEMGTEREGIEEKDLDKKSADFDPDEVKLGKDSE